MFRSSPHQNIHSLKASQKFLAKQHSNHNLFIFSCCGDLEMDDPQSLSFTTPAQSPKISIKQLKRKLSGMPLEKQSRSVSKSKSKKTKASNKTSIQTMKKKYQKKIKTQVNQVSNFQKTLIAKPDNQNKFKQIQKLNENDNSIHNFHTTNYIVGQCIVQPEQAKVIIQKQHHQAKSSIQDQFDSIFNQKNEKNPMKSFTFPLQDSQKLKKIEKRLRDNKIKQQLKPMVNFSFGQHQKKDFIGKYLNMLASPMKQSSNINSSEKSNRFKQIPMELYEIDSTIQEEIRKMNQQQSQLFLRATFQNRNSLNYLVNHVGRQVFKSQSEHSESKQSMVIDTHKSIIQKYKTQRQINFIS